MLLRTLCHRIAPSQWEVFVLLEQSLAECTAVSSGPKPKSFICYTSFLTKLCDVVTLLRDRLAPLGPAERSETAALRLQKATPKDKK